jgi:mono/diheme cytochrome c family protein
MFIRSRFVILTALAVLAAGCESGPHSAAGFRLPDDGDVERGKTAFMTQKCHSCHQVAGVDLPMPTVQPPVPVVLGGEVPKPMGDGYLVTSIINSSHRIGSHPRELTTADGRSRMPQYEELTVRQLTDIVAFLQSRYTVRMPQPKYPHI